MKYKVKKIFDIEDMPLNVRSVYDEYINGIDHYRAAFNEWNIGEMYKEASSNPNDYSQKTISMYKTIDDWLIESGANDSIGDSKSVIIVYRF